MYSGALKPLCSCFLPVFLLTDFHYANQSCKCSPVQLNFRSTKDTHHTGFHSKWNYLKMLFTDKIILCSTLETSTWFWFNPFHTHVYLFALFELVKSFCSRQVTLQYQTASGFGSAQNNKYAKTNENIIYINRHFRRRAFIELLANLISWTHPMKCPNNCWMDYHELWLRHSRQPQDGL